MNDLLLHVALPVLIISMTVIAVVGAILVIVAMIIMAKDALS